MRKEKQLLLALIPILGLVVLFSGLYVVIGFRGKTSEGGMEVVVSFYPLAYMAEQIGGEKISVTSLIKPGVETHSWQPSMQDIFITNDARMIIYNGAGFDNWMQDDVIPSIDLQGKILVDSTARLELIKNTEPNELEEHGQYDPHTWVSPKMAIGQSQKIYQAFIEADPENSEYYTVQWGIFQKKLEKIEVDYTNLLTIFKGRPFFTTHEAFGYIARDYNLTQFSIIGLSADQQPSTQVVAEIIEKMLVEQVDVFYLEPGYSEVYVQVIKEELFQKSGLEIKILKLYHMNGLTEGYDYLEQMERNLVNLKVGFAEGGK